MTELKGRIDRGVAWTGLGASAVGALDAVVLVALLKYWVSPEQLGIATLAAACFPALELAADPGLSAALVQRDDHNDRRSSTVFWTSLAISCGLVILLALGGPVVARFQGEPVVAFLLLGYGAKLLLQNVWIVPIAMLHRELRFREIAQVRILAGLGDVTAKIVVAAAGFPIWCFLAGPLAYALVFAVGAQITRPWRPRLQWNAADAKSCLRFGLQTSVTQLLYQVYSNADYMVVNKVFGATALGIYRVAYDLVLYTARFISDVVISVAFPAFARLRTDRTALAAQFQRFSRQLLAVTLPILAAVFVGADDLLATLFPRYSEGATAVRVLCLVGLLRSVAVLFPPLFDGVGKPGLGLVSALFATVLMPVAYISGAGLLGPRFGTVSVAIAWVVAYPLEFALLVRFGLSVAQLSLIRYLATLVGIAACAPPAVLAGLGVRQLTSALPATFRLLMESATVLLVIGLLLASWQKLSPRTAWQALRSSSSA
jgi:O-antigen/teichoic acid export membrane protein